MLLWPRSAAARVAQCGLTRMRSTASDNSGVSTCVLAILEQHKTFLRGLDDDIYTFHSPLVGGSVGQHTRHSLDHLRKPLELLAAQRQGSDENMLHYDIRDRHTPVETDRNAAIEQIEKLEKTLHTLPQSSLTCPVNAVFMLSADGQEFAFESTFSRELAFAVHHCIHHNALSKVLLRHHFPDLNAPDGFGMAPSTANFNLTHPQETHIQQYKRTSSLADYYVRGANGGKVFPQFKRCFGKDVHYEKLFTLKPMSAFPFENREDDLLRFAAAGAEVLRLAGYEEKDEHVNFALRRRKNDRIEPPSRNL